MIYQAFDFSLPLLTNYEPIITDPLESVTLYFSSLSSNCWKSSPSGLNSLYFLFLNVQEGCEYTHDCDFLCNWLLLLARQGSLSSWTVKQVFYLFLSLFILCYACISKGISLRLPSLVRRWRKEHSSNSKTGSRVQVMQDCFFPSYSNTSPSKHTFSH